MQEKTKKLSLFCDNFLFVTEIVDDDNNFKEN